MASGEAQLGGNPFFQRVPRFLLELEPWHCVFWKNLRDLLLRRSPKPLRLTSTPASFWPDVFVSTRPPWTELRQSLLYHAFVVTALWGFSQTYFIHPRVKLEPFTRNTTLTYYQVSEYLPPVYAATAPAKLARHGQPAYSKQAIISLPENPNNTRQTIVNPSAPKLIAHDVKLPNLVVSTPVPSPPVAGATRSATQLSLPWLAPAAVPPPAENTARQLADVSLPGRAPSVVGPPPDASVQRKLGDINVARSDLQVAAPQLPLPEQRSYSGEGQQTRAVPPAPPVSVGGSGAMQSAGQLLALGLDPAPVSGPIEVPGGSRRGEFAATPEGKPGGPGTPDIAAGGLGAGGTGKAGAGGAGHGNATGPAGIYVGPAPNPPAAVAGRTQASTFADARRNVIIAAARPAPDIPRSTPGADLPRTPAPGTVEQEVFGPRKYYSMVLNMPNLTSAGGSWIIRFTDLKQIPDQTDLTAPVAVHKVDPAYPSSLMRSNVEGTVTLYAIIRADGTVDAVKVLRGIDDALDRYASIALSHWQFRPATRHGVPVDLEAVVQIPFTAKKLPY